MQAFHLHGHVCQPIITGPGGNIATFVIICNNPLKTKALTEHHGRRMIIDSVLGGTV